MDVDFTLDVVGEKFLEPRSFDGGGDGENGVHLVVASADFADFGDDEQLRLADNAFAREYAASSVDEFAAERALIQSSAHAVAEADEDALL